MLHAESLIAISAFACKLLKYDFFQFVYNVDVDKLEKIQRRAARWVIRQ